MLYGFLAGIYFAVAVIVFLVVGFFCVLGGRSEELWKPFVYSLLWPIVPLFIGIRVIEQKLIIQNPLYRETK